MHLVPFCRVGADGVLGGTLVGDVQCETAPLVEANGKQLTGCWVWHLWPWARRWCPYQLLGSTAPFLSAMVATLRLRVVAKCLTRGGYRLSSSIQRHFTMRHTIPVKTENECAGRMHGGTWCKRWQILAASAHLARFSRLPVRPLLHPSPFRGCRGPHHDHLCSFVSSPSFARRLWLRTLCKPEREREGCRDLLGAGMVGCAPPTLQG